MKPVMTKKLFAFAIATIMFSCLTEFALAQKPKTFYLCRCGVRGYGCKPTDSHCAVHCAVRCGGFVSPVSINTPSLNKPSPNPDFQLSFPLFIIPESGIGLMLPLKDKTHFLKCPVHSDMRLIYEWNQAM